MTDRNTTNYPSHNKGDGKLQGANYKKPAYSGDMARMCSTNNTTNYPTNSTKSGGKKGGKKGGKGY